MFPEDTTKLVDQRPMAQRNKSTEKEINESPWLLQYSNISEKETNESQWLLKYPNVSEKEMNLSGSYNTLKLVRKG